MCTCKAPKQIEIISGIEVRAFCVLCHKSQDFFRTDDGKWETSAERMARMQVEAVCPKCGKTYATYDKWSETANYLCNDCNKEWRRGYDAERYEVKRAQQVYKTRSNPNSPWRIGVRGKAK